MTRPLLPPLIVVGAVLVAAGCGESSGARPAETPREVRLVATTRKDLARSVSAVGTLAAEERADLSFKVPGRLRKLHVDIGSRAEAGDVVAELEKTEYQLRLERARAALEQARARLGLPTDGASDDVEPEKTAIVRQNKAKMEQAAAELARNRSLLSEGLISHAIFDVVEANFKVAESQYHDALEEVNNRRGILAERRSSVALAAQELTDTSLMAPFSGSVQERKANAGEYLAAGTAVLSLVKLNPIRLRLEIPEREARSLRKGQAVSVRIEGEGTVWTGSVARVSPALQETNRSLIVEAEIANPKGALRPGSFVKAEIDAGSGGAVLVVPASSVIVFAGIEKVVTVRERKALETSVVTGRRAGDLVEIVSGLKEGDLVVDKPGNLATGMAVVPGPSASEAPRASAPAGAAP
jgi:RND family efflux transporter MFP subunit